MYPCNKTLGTSVKFELYPTSHPRTNLDYFLSPNFNSDVKTCSANEVIVSNNHDGESHTNELLNEVSALKDRNKSMETELKEMEERYSEISLKFAEVEGERQQLVMALRNLKNGKKN